MGRRGAVVVLLGALLATLVGLSAARQRADDQVETAKRFERFPLYWVGERFEKWDLKHVDVPGPYGFATLIYGDCKVEDPDGFFGPEGGSCPPPLSIQISPLCFHLDVVAQAPIWKRRSIRGAPVGSSDSAPVLFTRGAQVKVYRGQGSDPGLALRALRALRSLNTIPPVIGSSGRIPAADARVLTGAWPCRDSRPGRVVIDENAGLYRGVGIGASAAAVRRRLGDRDFARPNEGWSPGSSRFSEIGGPNVLHIPCRQRPGRPSRVRVLRYDGASFVLCRGRVFALMVTEKHARTQAGLAIGDDLEMARTLYPGLRCGQAPSGDLGHYPYCVGRMQPRRSLWFGQDPIASITVSTTRFPGVR